ncbi:MAG: DNA repair protein RecN [Acidobacteriota bacterium]
MLIEIHIQNLAVVESATLEFGGGFNVLSGETGAGKSIVVDSLALLSGVRASTDQIRTGAQSLSVAGIFEPAGDGWRPLLSEAGIELENDEIVLRREVARSGRNRAYVNDRPVTARLLAELAPYVIRIHGQREELGLVDPELQRTWLDQMGGDAGLQLIAEVGEAWRGVRDLEKRLSRLLGDDLQRRRRVEDLTYALEEIEAAGLSEGEETELRQERGILRHAEAIGHALAESNSALFAEDAARSGVSRALAELRGIAVWEPRAEAWVEELEELEIRLAELEPEISRRLGEVEADPRRLDEIEARLAFLERIFTKYGESSAAVLEEQSRLQAELLELGDAETGRERLEAELAAAVKAYTSAAGQLSERRARWAETLGSRVLSHIRDLALEKARFEPRLERRLAAGSPVEVDGDAIEAGELGWDQVVYYFSPNPGEEMRPLAKVASGGELSRLYLAVQLACREDDSAAASAGATLVFDEVDAGISGAEAAVLGRKMKRLARGQQILAVTHLPQVASAADAHFGVHKEVTDGRTRTRVEPLAEDGRVREVARMLAGSRVTSLSLDHARELIAGASA